MRQEEREGGARDSDQRIKGSQNAKKLEEKLDLRTVCKVDRLILKKNRFRQTPSPARWSRTFSSKVGHHRRLGQSMTFFIQRNCCSTACIRLWHHHKSASLEAGSSSMPHMATQGPRRAGGSSSKAGSRRQTSAYLRQRIRLQALEPLHLRSRKELLHRSASGLRPIVGCCLKLARSLQSFTAWS